MIDPSPSSKVRAGGVVGALVVLVLAVFNARGYDPGIDIDQATVIGAAIGSFASVLSAYLKWERRGTNPPPAE